ncbi:cellulase family glycosylhydrolase [candidate division KSB3 bacterium]|uniref:Cellulase family glycosylhydrolase n=1 Tax=candidate division KSB3 bacterium TaxID=2044937 RepID=A0A9D5JX21_9BACT|nr:cellulase family glycosylhydrolase [candidate division KSB3 bacterium]MBD3325705.1 cellulase family glycosylhydrolase [candidate division KSB3 bacterium]
MSMFTRAGDQLHLRATGQPVQLLIIEQFGFSNFPDGQMLQFIDAVKNSGANGVRVFAFYPFGKGREEEPYPLINGRFDLGQFNDAYFTYLRQWVEHAAHRGVAVLFELFDSVGLKFPQVADYHPFGQFTHGDLEAFSNLMDQNLERQQKHYLTQMVNTLKQYPNVIFGIMNEFHGDPAWHYEMARHVKALAPDHLTSGTEEGSPAMDDPNVDIWTIHTGSYDFGSCQGNVEADVAHWRPEIEGKILGFSTDGFGRQGVKCEHPDAMRRLAQQVKEADLPIFCFLDHAAYVGMDDAGREYPLGEWIRQDHVYDTAQVSKLNIATYTAIAEVYPGTPLPDTGGSTPLEPPELPEGFLYVFDANYLNSTHPDVRREKGGKAVAATTTQGYVGRTQQISDLPLKPLEVYFSIFIDNTTYDDALVLILDVHDAAHKKVLANWAVTRKQFAEAQAFNLLKLTFTPPENAQLEFRVYYFGYAYVVFDKMTVIDPAKAQISAPEDIPDLHSRPTTPETPLRPVPGHPTSPPETSPGEEEGVIDVFSVSKLPSNHPHAFRDRGGKAIRATTVQGFLAYGQYVTGYPTQPLDVYFSVYIDNNTADDRRILTLDVYDSAQKKLLAQAFISRKQFPKANAFNLFKLTFTSTEQSKLEFRIFYNGWSYVAADKIAVVEPEKIQISTHDDLLALSPEPGGIVGPLPPLDEKIFVSESLKDETSQGHISVGSFTPEGVQLHGGDGYIGYKIPTTPRGFIEFTASGFVQGELHGGTEYKGVLVTMWDGGAGYSYETAPYIFEMRKYGYIEGRPDASDTLWFKIKSNGHWTENHYNVLGWDSTKRYRFRMEWGGGHTKVMRDGQMVAEGIYQAEFAPPDHRIQIGANPLRGRKTVHNLLVSDVVIGRI